MNYNELDHIIYKALYDNQSTCSSLDNTCLTGSLTSTASPSSFPCSDLLFSAGGIIADAKC